MHGQQVGSRPGEVAQVPVRVSDHQVALHHSAHLMHLRREGLDRPGAEGQVGHEMTVHDINVDPPGPGRQGLGHLLSQPGAVRRKDRRAISIGSSCGDVRVAIAELRPLAVSPGYPESTSVRGGAISSRDLPSALIPSQASTMPPMIMMTPPTRYPMARLARLLPLPISTP